MCGYKKRPEELIRSLDTGVVGGHQLSKMGGIVTFMSFARAISTFNHWTISPVPTC